MRPAALLTALCALSTSATAFDVSSLNAGDLTGSAASLYSHYKTENPTQLASQANSIATGALATLSQLAATATGSLASSLKAEYTSLKSEYAGAQSTLKSLTGSSTPTGSSSPSSSASASASSSSTPSTGLAPVTVVPIAAVGIGMVLLGFM